MGERDRAGGGGLRKTGCAAATRGVRRDAPAFTYWPAVAAFAGPVGERGNGGRRIDLQVISDELKHSVEHGAVYTGARFSRHAPLIVDYDIDL